MTPPISTQEIIMILFEYYIELCLPHWHAIDTIRFLSMASLLDVWINKVVDIRKDSQEVDERVKRTSGKHFKEKEEKGILEQPKEIRSLPFYILHHIALMNSSR